MVEQVLLVGGLVAPLVYAAGILSAAMVFPGYRHSRQFLSELGTVESPKASHFNLGLGLSGLVLVAFALGVGQGLGSSGTSAGIMVGLTVGGVTNLLQAGFRCDPGCPNPPESRAGLVHGLSGLIGSLGLAAAMVLAGIFNWLGAPVFAVYSLLSGVAGILLLVVLMARPGLKAPGAVQRVYVTVTFAWVLVFSLVLLGQ